MSLAIAKKPSLGMVHKKRRDGMHSDLNSFHISHRNPQVSTIQRKPNCPCGGGCPRCKNNLTIQTKLKINELGDKYEQEADRVAEQVMRMPGNTAIIGQTSVARKEDGAIQRKPT